MLAILRTIKIALLTGLIGVSAASAQPAISGPDLLVDLDQFVGKEVILEHTEVHGADNDGALVKSDGVTFKISTDGIDPETFRQFLKSCSRTPAWGESRPPECKVRLLVTPNGKKFIGWPILTNVKVVR
jgi:hypothetical protein